jgi:hypothetical protein
LGNATAGTGTALRSTCTCRATLVPADLVQVESDDVLLSTYRQQLTPQFPFVVIPPGLTAKEVATSRPFLMQVIRMAASVRDLRSMRAQSCAVLKHISDAMLARSERSMDLLQGILVFLGFYHNLCLSHAHFNSLAHLAVGLVGDLDLSICPTSKMKERYHRFAMAPVSGQKRPRTNDERRALLGVWYMSTK